MNKIKHHTFQTLDSNIYNDRFSLLFFECSSRVYLTSAVVECSGVRLFPHTFRILSGFPYEKPGAAVQTLL